MNSTGTSHQRRYSISAKSAVSSLQSVRPLSSSSSPPINPTLTLTCHPTPGLFWLAFTTYPSIHWILPILGSLLFGAGTYLIFTSVFTYLVVAYRPVAASALASNSVMRLSFGAVFPLFANAMYARLGTVGATALLAGLTSLMAPCP